jgi:hypothetical protein
MRRILMATISGMLVGILILGISPAMAGKTQDVIENSNGYLSGLHFNWKVQGKDTSTCLCEEVLPGVKSVFIDEYGESKIRYVTNKKSNVTDLMVQEPCAGCFNDHPDDTSAKVVVPYEREDLYVFSRVRAILDNEQKCSNPDSIRFHPNLLGNARNDVEPASPDFPFSIEPPDAQLLTLESSNIRYVHNTTPEKYVIYELATVQGKEKTKPSDVTRLFKWLGSFSATSVLDTNADGKTDAYVFTFVIYY